MKSDLTMCKLCSDQLRKYTSEFKLFIEKSNQTIALVYREFWTSIPDVLSPHGASLNLAIAPEALLKVLKTQPTQLTQFIIAF